LEDEEGWYRLTIHQIKSTGGSGLLWRCGSILNALQYAFPEKTFRPWLFDQSNSGAFDDAQSQLEFWKWLGKELGIEDPKLFLLSITPTEIRSR
jgi:hypothetical protein